MKHGGELAQLVKACFGSHVMRISRTFGSTLLMACVLMLGSSRHARAADGGAAGADDIKALEKQLSDEHAALSTADCTAACRALGSIRRAAEKICAIEPGPRCDTAREKAADATRRVHDACPDCALAFGPQPPAPPPAPAEPERGGSGASPTTANAPPAAEDRRSGGCASCSSTAADAGGVNGDLGLVVLAAFGVLRVASRRRRRR